MNQVTVNISLEPELSEALKGFKLPAQLRAIQRGMNKGMQYMVGQITAERLTGRGPFPVSDHRLGVVTGRLRQSFHATSAEIQGNQVTGALGASVEYAAAHEFGFKGEVDVRSFTRSSGVKVKAHRRNIEVPERAMVRTGIADHIDEVTTSIGEEVVATMRGEST